MKLLLLLTALTLTLVASAQTPVGILAGSVIDEQGRPLEAATVDLTSMADTSLGNLTLTDALGNFQINQIPFGYYRLKFSFAGFQTLIMDSIHFREERYDFNLNEIKLKPDSARGALDEIIIYAEKPLIESRDGNVTFNAGESALSQGSSANELLATVPLVSKDPEGKILVRGKAPRILIDDKPVEMSQEQLQDLLESMPGSSIEKIEVLTNPPPQYANEEGGVINIVTKKGSVGMNGRVSVYYGSRGDYGANASFNYRKQGLSLSAIAGLGYGVFYGNGYSNRVNFDSSKYYNANDRDNESIRPNFRVNMNYDINTYHQVTLTLHYNSSGYLNNTITDYDNRNRFGNITNLSRRTVLSDGDNFNPSVAFSYLMKTKKAGESLRLVGNVSPGTSRSVRDFYQVYYNTSGQPNGKDSTQRQVNDNSSNGYNYRITYTLPLNERKTTLVAGSNLILNKSLVQTDATYLSSLTDQWITDANLTNHFLFRQRVANGMASIRQVIKDGLKTTVGVNVEQTNFSFDLYSTGKDTANNYFNVLPFVNVVRTWQNDVSLTLSYRRTVNRPGITQLNPTIDFSDLYTVRYGNPSLLPSVSDNFDLILGKNKGGFFANLSLGYNAVQDIFSQLRTLQTDGKTLVTWQNLSGRKEYQVSTWSGYTINKKTRINFSANYTYNTYSAFDRSFRNYRNGATFTSSLNGNYLWKGLYTATANFTFNRFANPQGSVKSNLSMNIGLQGRFINKKLTASLNIIDPFFQQQNTVFTYGTNFLLENYNSTKTRNYRVTLAYTLTKKPKKKSGKTPGRGAATGVQRRTPVKPAEKEAPAQP